MGSETHQLHIAVLPFMAAGHLIPTLDIVMLLAARDNVETITIITTPLNAPTITNSLDKHQPGSISKTRIHIIPFPPKEATDLPDGLESCDQVTSQEMSINFLCSSELLRPSVERFLSDTRPDCLIADFFFPFATDAAAKFGIPRIVFQGISFFAKSAMEAETRYKAHNSVSSDEEEFILPSLPHEVRLTRSQISPREGTEMENRFIRFSGAASESAMKSYGEIFNSFYELEPDYIQFFRNVLRRKAWHIGPVSLSARKSAEECRRGKKPAIAEHECLEWLDSKEPNSVIYICFGSSINLLGPQLREIAMALDFSGYSFIWKLKEGIKDDEFLPDGYGERVQGRGLFIRGWAPQVLILEHKSIGGFVTHCGWNSTLESVSAGVPMVTWPMFADQFYNEKLVTDILKIGVQVGSKIWSFKGKGTFLKREEIVAALRKIMEGDEALEIRNRAEKLKDLARIAVEEGGSSYCDLSSFLQELVSCQP